MKTADLLNRFEKVRRAGSGWSACCPAHDDRSPSLSIAEGEGGRLLMRCMAGCSTVDVLAAVGLTMSDLFPDDGNGRQRLPCGRFVDAVKPKRGPRPTKPPEVDLLPHARHWFDGADRSVLADRLGVSVDALSRLRVGRACGDDLAKLGNLDRPAWTFPMRDHVGGIIGVRLRYDDGSKRAVVGSRHGLFHAADLRQRPDVLHIVEGPSDTAALLTLGFEAVGLPAAGQGIDTLALLLMRVKPRHLLLIADADEPGRKGMHQVAGQLAKWGHTSRVTDPPGGADDVRAYVNARGNRAGIEQLRNSPEVSA